MPPLRADGVRLMWLCALAGLLVGLGFGIGAGVPVGRRLARPRPVESRPYALQPRPSRFGDTDARLGVPARAQTGPDWSRWTELGGNGGGETTTWPAQLAETHVDRLEQTRVEGLDRTRVEEQPAAAEEHPAPPVAETRVDPVSATAFRWWEQPLPDADARGVARPPGPAAPGQRRARIRLEESGEYARIPGDRTTWIGRHSSGDDADA
ncbi:hypothetical protein [Actinoplanes sp. URMC 104]|uniref:hypothetical protein n=1 Tax=Actinoplanes sp. URMC 104 TaxID=3423409 RepID=UPI003F1C7350